MGGQTSIFSGVISKPNLRTRVMGHSEIGFAPARMDRGSDVHVLAGTQGELAIVDSEGSPIGSSSTPFPSPTIGGLVMEDKWVGIWLDRELRQARMAALPLDVQWKDGPSREDLRLSLASNAVDLGPANSIWQRVLDSEPMKMGEAGGGVVFATISGTYMIDSDANEVWRGPVPRWPQISNLGQPDNVVSINEFPGGVAMWSQAGGISILDPSNGMEIYSRVVEFGDKVSKVIYSDEGGWLVILHGGSIAVMGEVEGEISTFMTSGPVLDSRFLGGMWHWTGWRHDGVLSGDRIISAQRDDIGIALVGGNVLTNEGNWTPFMVDQLSISV